MPKTRHKSHSLLAYARLGKDGKVSIPTAVRGRLRLRRGSTLLFEDRDGAVTIRRLVRVNDAFTRSLESTLSEWNSANDDEAFRDL